MDCHDGFLRLDFGELFFYREGAFSHLAFVAAYRDCIRRNLFLVEFLHIEPYPFELGTWIRVVSESHLRSDKARD